MLALVHRAQGRLNIPGLGDSRHGGSEEHTDSKRAAQQERIPRLNPPLGPGLGTLAVHAEGDL